MVLEAGVNLNTTSFEARFLRSEALAKTTPGMQVVQTGSHSENHAVSVLYLALLFLVYCLHESDFFGVSFARIRPKEIQIQILMEDVFFFLPANEERTILWAV